jgi:hypothetical protein
MTDVRWMGWRASISLLLLLGIPTVAHAENLRIDLTGFEEVPALSTAASGKFSATISDTQITYELRYADLEGAVQQAHIHFAQAAVNGAIVAFLCTNLGNGPAGTQPCPGAPATITGTIGPGDVGSIAAAQGIDSGEFAKLVAAIRARTAYVNVHSTQYPAGEIRGQLPRNVGALGDDDER